MPEKRNKCPQCGKPAEREERCFPFCSERCQLLDLGAWASEKYRVASVNEEDEDGESSLVREEIEH